MVVPDFFWMFCNLKHMYFERIFISTKTVHSAIFFLTEDGLWDKTNPQKEPMRALLHRMGFFVGLFDRNPSCTPYWDRHTKDYFTCAKSD